MNKFGFTCCFCNQSIASSKTDPADINVLINIDKTVDMQYSQNFYCHIACFRKTLHGKIEIHFHLHNLLDDLPAQYLNLNDSEHWKTELRKLEKNREWEEAIVFMEQVILCNLDDVDPFIFMNYLLMNLLVAEQHNQIRTHYYEELIKENFKESYRKFSTNPEYLFYTGITAIINEWYSGITQQASCMMMQQAIQYAPNNVLYQWSYYSSLPLNTITNKQKAMSYVRLILNNDPELITPLTEKGALGEYILNCMIQWAKNMIKN